MKKIVLMFISALICGMLFTSCNDEESPSNVAEKVCKAYTTKDWATYFEYLYLDITEDEKKSMLDEWYKTTHETDLNPCVKYKVLGEKISADGQKANVTVKFVFQDGTEITNDKFCFTKTDDGWRMQRFAREVFL